MTRKVRGGDGVLRDRVGRAPDWSPARPGMVKALTSAAAAFEARAQETGVPGLAIRAGHLRAEAEVARSVVNYTPPTLTPAGIMPYGPGRGAIDKVSIVDIAFDPKSGGPAISEVQVRRRRASRALKHLSPALQRAASDYAGLCEAVASPGARNPDAPRGSGVSDGGAVSRCALVARLKAADAAIGGAVILAPKGAAAHADRARRPITADRLVYAVAVKGMSLRALLARFGWSRWRRNEEALADALEAALGRVADALACHR